MNNLWGWFWFGVAIAIAIGPADACHHFAVWRYPWPQHCPTSVAQTEPLPPPKAREYFETPGDPDIDIPLPSLEEGMEFPPDASGDWDRLKGIGLLRQLNGTN